MLWLFWGSWAILLIYLYINLCVTLLKWLSVMSSFWNWQQLLHKSLCFSWVWNPSLDYQFEKFRTKDSGTKLRVTLLLNITGVPPWHFHIYREAGEENVTSSRSSAWNSSHPKGNKKGLNWMKYCAFFTFSWKVFHLSALMWKRLFCPSFLSISWGEMFHVFLTILICTII